RRAQTCPQTCADETPFGMLCENAWTSPTMGVAATIVTDGSSCSVPWAKVDLGLAGGGGAGGTGADGAQAGGDADDASHGCSCRAGGGGRPLLPWAAACVALTLAAAARRSRARKT